MVRGAKRHTPPFLYLTKLHTAIDEKVALVTGGSQGIGQAISVKLASEGASVVIAYHSVHEELPFPNFAPYCLSKGGMKMMARDLARSIQAKAFTTGQDVFFRQGAYELGSHKGQELIAHELTHVVRI